MHLIVINGQERAIPDTLHEITLGQRIEYAQWYGNVLDEQQERVAQMKEGPDKDIAQTDWICDMACKRLAYFAGVTPEAFITSPYLSTAYDLYFNHLHACFMQEDGIGPLSTHYTWNGSTWTLPPPVLLQDSTMTLGEFVDSKQKMKEMTEIQAYQREQVSKGAEVEQPIGRYDFFLPLVAIFFRKEGESYDESFLYPNSERLQLIRSLPVDWALEVGAFYDQLSTFINDNFPLFKPSRGKSGSNMKNHYNFWGWLEFVIEVAGAPQFLISGSGLNGIQCARAAKLYDVLLWASANKERNEAEYLDHQAEMAKNS